MEVVEEEEEEEAVSPQDTQLVWEEEGSNTVRKTNIHRKAEEESWF